MRPHGTDELDPLLRLQRDDDPYRYLTRTQRWRVRFWAWIADYVEARWLSANGWKSNGDGWWKLPDWHPKAHLEWSQRHKKNDRVRYINATQLYDQNHASNSQRYYIRTVQTRDTKGHKAAPFPRYRLEPYVAATTCLSLLVTTLGYSFNSEQMHYGFVLASSLLFCVSFCLSHYARRDIELDWAETKLMGKHPNGSNNSIHHPH